MEKNWGSNTEGIINITEDGKGQSLKKQLLISLDILYLYLSLERARASPC